MENHNFVLVEEIVAEIAGVGDLPEEEQVVPQLPPAPQPMPPPNHGAIVRPPSLLLRRASISSLDESSQKIIPSDDSSDKYDSIFCNFEVFFKLCLQSQIQPETKSSVQKLFASQEIATWPGLSSSIGILHRCHSGRGWS